MADPDDAQAGRPDRPDKRSWNYVLRKTMREFSEDQCTDQAAALTYYAVLAIFPAALALVSVLGVFGQADKAVDTVVNVLEPLVNKRMLGRRAGAEPIAESDVRGLHPGRRSAGALWSASGYVGAFGRAMNRIYEIDEGRPFWKLRPVMLVITLVAVLLAAMVLLILVVSGPLAESIGDPRPRPPPVTVWSIAKWPVLGSW